MSRPESSFSWVSRARLQDVNRRFSHSQMCHRMCISPPRWSYGWFGWFTKKTRRGWVGVYLWPQRLINNRLHAPPATLAQADDSQVRRLQLPWTDEGIRHGEGIHCVRSALLSLVWIFQELKKTDVGPLQPSHPIEKLHFAAGWGFAAGRGFLTLTPPANREHDRDRFLSHRGDLTHHTQNVKQNWICQP